ncbi:ChaN family lipoprotein [Halomonas sp. DN3]|uniref:ChaN family lipoprotein n=1 Tax=Halomonas sp. DN3 TaxID=2953657 RepID=UPI0020A02062|nr:ChaN family lipoprotein [Halomonas sp. DN3]USZ51498.1 ChaN family lipoprotein [Halomonas sp. DN3]
MPRLATLAMLLVLGLDAQASCTSTATGAGLAPGDWIAPGDARAHTAPAMGWPMLARQQVVLLGEQHDRPEHHRFQLASLAALHAHHPNLAIGLEMLPRESQPALDAWIAGDIDEAALLEQSQWYRYWGFDPELYLPVLRFARDQALPLKALNVTPELRQRLVEDGVSTLPPAQRHGIPEPVPAMPSYRERLEASLEEHALELAGEGFGQGFGDDMIDGFVYAQQVWDMAMAQRLAALVEDGHLVVGLVGMGHASHGEGIEAQLESLGIADVASLLPLSADDACEAEAGLADAAFVVREDKHNEGPPLGVGVESSEDRPGLVVTEVIPNSPAEAAGLRVGDRILSFAGRDIAHPYQLKALVPRVLPGTQASITVTRDHQRQTLTVSFPIVEPALDVERGEGTRQHQRPELQQKQQHEQQQEQEQLPQE